MDPMILGWIATVLFSVAIIPQIVKTIKTKTTDGVSLLLFIINLVANIIAMAYAVIIMQPPLQIKYIIGITVSAIYIGVYIYYRRKA